MTHAEIRKVLAIVITFRDGSCDLDCIDIMISVMRQRGDDIDLTLCEDGIDSVALLDGDLSCLEDGAAGAGTCADYSEFDTSILDH